MPTRIGDLFPEPLLRDMIDQGYVRTQTHPQWPWYWIFNYTEKAQYERVWNDVTRQCRGLIVNAETGTVLARPFRKFFNYGEADAAVFDLDDPVAVHDKLDGSLGILYPNPPHVGGYSIATRGSFASEQAKHATELWRLKYAHRYEPILGYTDLFEIVFPANRIVVDYGDTDDLVMLGRVNIATGETAALDLRWPNQWPGNSAQTFEYRSLRQALAAPARPNAEGFVVWFPRTDERVKIKQADYVALHRIITGLNARLLWTHMAVHACKHHLKQDKHWGTYLGMDPKDVHRVLAAGDDWLDTLTERVPDECYDWIKHRMEEIGQAVSDVRDSLALRFGEYRARGVDRRGLWEATREDPMQKALLLMWDRRIEDVNVWIWRTVKPEHERPYLSVSEDVA